MDERAAGTPLLGGVSTELLISILLGLLTYVGQFIASKMLERREAACQNW